MLKHIKYQVGEEWARWEVLVYGPPEGSEAGEMTVVLGGTYNQGVLLVLCTILVEDISVLKGISMPASGKRRG